MKYLTSLLSFVGLTVSAPVFSFPLGVLHASGSPTSNITLLVITILALSGVIAIRLWKKGSSR